MPTGQPEQHESSTSEFLRGDYALAAEDAIRRRDAAAARLERRPYPERRRARRRWMARRLRVGRAS